jgi:hypothetical protein
MTPGSQGFAALRHQQPALFAYREEITHEPMYIGSMTDHKAARPRRSPPTGRAGDLAQLADPCRSVYNLALERLQHRRPTAGPRPEA